MSLGIFLRWQSESMTNMGVRVDHMRASQPLKNIPLPLHGMSLAIAMEISMVRKKESRRATLRNTRADLAMFFLPLLLFLLLLVVVGA